MFVDYDEQKNAVSDFIKTWRKLKEIDATGELTSQQKALFVQELQQLLSNSDNFRPIDNNSVTFTPDSKPIFYTGSIDKIPTWTMAQKASATGGGSLNYISDSLNGKLLNDGDIKFEAGSSRRMQ